MMYILGVIVMQVHHGRWVGTSFLFIGRRKPTYVGFCSLGVITHLRRFYTEVYKEGSFNSLRGRIFHSQFFFIGKTFSLGQSMRSY